MYLNESGINGCGVEKSGNGVVNAGQMFSVRFHEDSNASLNIMWALSQYQIFINVRNILSTISSNEDLKFYRTALFHQVLVVWWDHIQSTRYDAVNLSYPD